MMTSLKSNGVEMTINIDSYRETIGIATTLELRL